MAFEEVGVFNAKPVMWGLNQSRSSQACSLSIEWNPYEIMDNKLKKFVEYPNLDNRTVFSDTWFIGKDGKINERNVQTVLVDTFGWSGEVSDFDDIDKFKPPACQIEVEEDEYKGVIRYKVAWVNPLGGGERKTAMASSDVLASIADRFGDNIKKAMKGEKQDELPDPEDEIPF